MFMGENKKKIFPKIQKKIKSFLTDESGKITKKDALGLGVCAMLFSGVEEVGAGHTNEYYGLPSYNQHKSGFGGYCTVNQSYSKHASGVVNGHYSSNITGNTSGLCFGGTSGHSSTSHGSHGSHGSGGWC